MKEDESVDISQQFLGLSNSELTSKNSVSPQNYRTLGYYSIKLENSFYHLYGTHNPSKLDFINGQDVQIDTDYANLKLQIRFYVNHFVSSLYSFNQCLEMIGSEDLSKDISLQPANSQLPTINIIKPSHYLIGLRNIFEHGLMDNSLIEITSEKVKYEKKKTFTRYYLHSHIGNFKNNKNWEDSEYKAANYLTYIEDYQDNTEENRVNLLEMISKIRQYNLTLLEVLISEQ